jgi:hypothetical protein
MTGCNVLRATDAFLGTDGGRHVCVVRPWRYCRRQCAAPGRLSVGRHELDRFICRSRFGSRLAVGGLRIGRNASVSQILTLAALQGMKCRVASFTTPIRDDLSPTHRGLSAGAFLSVNAEDKRPVQIKRLQRWR